MGYRHKLSSKMRQAKAMEEKWQKKLDLRCDDVFGKAVIKCRSSGNGFARRISSRILELCFLPFLLFFLFAFLLLFFLSFFVSCISFLFFLSFLPSPFFFEGEGGRANNTRKAETVDKIDYGKASTCLFLEDFLPLIWRLSPSCCTVAIPNPHPKSTTTSENNVFFTIFVNIF